MPAISHLKLFAEMVSSRRGRTPLPLDVTQNLDEGGYYEIEVATATTEEALVIISATQGIETIQTLVVTSDRDILVTLGVAANNVGVPCNAGGFVALARTSLTAVSISNSSGATANVGIYIGGT